KEAGAAPTGALHRALRGEAAGRRAAGAEAGRVQPVGAGTESFDARRDEGARPADAKRVAAQPTKASPSTGDTTLVGRTEELARISSVLADAIAERRGRLVLVCGEPGIGKSRLLEAAAALARDAGAFLLEASAFESESIRPFALWIDALRRV